ncbi:MAG: hypothetical protein AAF945_09205 [Actinomycetota bacterium]
MSIDDPHRPGAVIEPHDVDRIARAFWDLTLPKPEWTHEAHLAVCWVTLRTHSPDAALALIRPGIRRYNASVGTIDTDTSGYHETLTRYFVATVADIAAPTFQALVTDERVGRAGPLRHWSRDRLVSGAARRGWLEPDLAPVPGVGRLDLAVRDRR